MQSLRSLILVYLYLFYLVSEVMSVPHPSFPKQFSGFIETITDGEPDFLTVFIDAPHDRSRYDYLNENVVYIYRYDLKFQLIYNLSSHTCEKSQLNGSIEPIFPTFQNGTLIGNATIRGVLCNHFSVKVYNEFKNETIPADYFATVHDNIPMRLVWDNNKKSQGTIQITFLSPLFYFLIVTNSGLQTTQFLTHKHFLSSTSSSPSSSSSSSRSHTFFI